MPITTSAHPKALWPGVKKWFGQGYNYNPAQWSQLVDEETSDKKYEEYVNHSGFPMAKTSGEGVSVDYVTSAQGFTARITNVTYQLGYVVTQEELEDNRYKELSAKRAPALGRSFAMAKENVVAALYNTAFTSTMADGVALISASHPLTATGGVASNVLTVASNLSEAAIEDATIQLMQLVDDNGYPIMVRPQSLHVHPAEYFNANRILKTAQQTGTANNDINVVKALGVIPKGVFVNNFFTSQRAWYIRTTEKGLVYQKRIALDIRQDNDFDTKNAKTAGRERYGVGAYDWRSIFGSPGV